MKKYLLILALITPSFLVVAAHCPEQYTLQGNICLIKAAPVVPCTFIPETSGLICEHSAYLDLPSQVTPIEDEILPSLPPATIISPKVGSSSTVVVKYKFLRVLRPGFKGIEVSELQKRLIAEGFYKGSVSGFFDNLTKKALMTYQRKNRLTPSGILNKPTIAKMNQ